MAMLSARWCQTPLITCLFVSISLQFTNVLAYNMSKSAVNQFTQSVAMGNDKKKEIEIALNDHHTFDNVF